MDVETGVPEIASVQRGVDARVIGIDVEVPIGQSQPALRQVHRHHVALPFVLIDVEAEERPDRLRGRLHGPSTGVAPSTMSHL